MARFLNAISPELRLENPPARRGYATLAREDSAQLQPPDERATSGGGAQRACDITGQVRCVFGGQASLMGGLEPATTERCVTFRRQLPSANGTCSEACWAFAAPHGASRCSSSAKVGFCRASTPLPAWRVTRALPGVAGRVLGVLGVIGPRAAGLTHHPEWLRARRLACCRYPMPRHATAGRRRRAGLGTGLESARRIYPGRGARARLDAHYFCISSAVSSAPVFARAPVFACRSRCWRNTTYAACRPQCLASVPGEATATPCWLRSRPARLATQGWPRTGRIAIIRHAARDTLRAERARDRSASAGDCRSDLRAEPRRAQQSCWAKKSLLPVCDLERGLAARTGDGGLAARAGSHQATAEGGRKVQRTAKAVDPAGRAFSPGCTQAS